MERVTVYPDFFLAVGLIFVAFHRWVGRKAGEIKRRGLAPLERRARICLVIGLVLMAFGIVLLLELIPSAQLN
jgi:hypothetical protein